MSAEKISELLKDRQFSTDDYQKGDFIAYRDTAYSGLMILLKGKVRGETADSQGLRTLVDVIAAPQLIAPAFLFGGYNRLPIDVVADEPVTVLTLHRGLLFELMQENTIIMSNFIDIISNRANMLSRKIFFLSFRTIREKMSAYLLEQSRTGHTLIDISDMNKLAEDFDAPRSAITAVIADLVKHKIIEQLDNKLKILNPEALKK